MSGIGDLCLLAEVCDCALACQTSRRCTCNHGGAIDPAALDTFVAHGPTGRPPSPWVFNREPDEPSWMRALGHQTVLRVTAHDAMAIVQQAWVKASR